VTFSWDEIQNYFYQAGIIHSDYPKIIWDKIVPYIKNYHSLMDIGCGNGAFTLKALEEGFNVTSIDCNYNSLEALKCEIVKRNLCQRSSVVFGDWENVKAKKCDVSIASYCFNGYIGSKKGIEKILLNTNYVSVFVLPAVLEKGEFYSKDLYNKLNIDPPLFNRNDSFENIVQAANMLGKNLIISEIQYDFGIPYENKSDRSIYFLCEKLKIYDRNVIEEHIENIKTFKNGIQWIPNIRKSLLVICRDKKVCKGES